MLLSAQQLPAVPGRAGAALQEPSPGTELQPLPHCAQLLNKPLGISWPNRRWQDPHCLHCGAMDQVKGSFWCYPGFVAPPLQVGGWLTRRQAELGAPGAGRGRGYRPLLCLLRAQHPGQEPPQPPLHPLVFSGLQEEGEQGAGASGRRALQGRWRPSHPGELW